MALRFCHLPRSGEFSIFLFRVSRRDGAERGLDIRARMHSQRRIGRGWILGRLQKIAADSKSVAYRFHYREPTRTLRTDEIDAAHQQVLEALMKGLGVKFR